MVNFKALNSIMKNCSKGVLDLIEKQQKLYIKYTEILKIGIDKKTMKIETKSIKIPLILFSKENNK